MFTLVKRSLGDVPAFEWHTPAQAVGETALGKALSVAKEAALCGAAQRPYGIGMGKPRQDGRIPVCQVLPDMEWETRSAARGDGGSNRSDRHPQRRRRRRHRHHHGRRVHHHPCRRHRCGARPVSVRRRREMPNTVIFSKSSGLNDDLYGNSLAPIRGVIEENVESFRAMSIIDKVYYLDTSKNFAEKYTAGDRPGRF